MALLALHLRVFSARAYVPALRGHAALRPAAAAAAAARFAPVRMASTEEEKAARAAAKEMEAKADRGEPTLFDKIVAGDIPSDTVYSDDLCMVFRDVNPQAPTHLLVIPKDRDGLSRLSKADERHKAILGHLLFVAQKVAGEQGLQDEGFRVVVNDGPHGAQSIYHLHLHVLGGRQMSWPPG